MSKIENITEKIILDAENESKEIIEKANNDAKNILNTKVDKSTLESKKIVEKASVEAENIVEKALSSAKLKARDNVLEAKEEVVERVFSLVTKKLENLDTLEYIKYLKKSLEKLNIKESDILYIPSKYKEAVEKEALNIKISKDPVESGFSILSGNIMYNNKFTSLVDAKKSDLEYEVAKKLFK